MLHVRIDCGSESCLVRLSDLVYLGWAAVGLLKTLDPTLYDGAHPSVVWCVCVFCACVFSYFLCV